MNIIVSINGKLYEKLYAHVTLFSTLKVFDLPVEGINNNQFAYCLRFSRVKMRILLLFHLQNILVQNNNMSCPIFFIVE